MDMSLKKNHGFTLVEVLTVITILAIIAAIAIPSYNTYILKAKRSSAKNILSTISSKMETYKFNNKAYPTALTQLNYPANPFYVNEDLEPSAVATGSIYKITLSGVSGITAYTLTAEYQNTQIKDTNCKTFTINQLGTKTSTDSSNNSTDNCW